MTVTQGQLKGPVRLIVNEKTSFGLRGTVVDEAGKPIANAEVTPQPTLQFANFGLGVPCEPCTTDVEGKFAIGGFWPGETYSVRISAKGYDNRGSAQVTGIAGGVHDFGKLVLVDMGGAVEGKIVDSAGKSLANVRVFNSGDAAKLLETRSDRDGHFRLQGFRKGPVYVFAEKDGCRFAGVRTASGVTDVVLKVLRCDEPPAKWSPSPSLSSADADREHAWRLLERVLDAADDGNEQWVFMLMSPRIPERARQRMREAKVPGGAPDDRYLIRQIADADLDEALAVAAKNGNDAYYLLKELADHFVASDPKKAMRCVEEAVIQARALDQPQRAMALAGMGAMVTRLGNKQAGKMLTEEAIAMTGKWKPSERMNYMFGQFVVAVAVNDPSRRSNWPSDCPISAIAIVPAPPSRRKWTICRRLRSFSARSNHGRRRLAACAWHIASPRSDPPKRFV